MGIYILIIILIVLLVLLICKLIVIYKSINEIINEMPNILNNDTNTLITLSSSDKQLRKLANSLNKELKNLRKLELEFKQKNNNLSNLYTNITHDLRTPLTVIKGYLDILDNHNLTSKQKDYLNHISKKIDDITNLTEELFNYSKILDEKLEKEDICVNEILEEILAGYYILFQQNNITPCIVITKEKIIRHINSTVLKRIIENVVYNAIKYSEGNFELILNEKGELKVSNKTKKIDRTSLNKLFDRFYTVENAQKSNGIGLSIAKQLVELNGGKITAKYKKITLLLLSLFKIK